MFSFVDFDYPLPDLDLVVCIVLAVFLGYFLAWLRS